MKAEIQWLRNAVCDGRAYLRYYRGKGRADPQGDAVDGYLTRVALVNRGKVQP
jgi:hypothetical protein